MLRGKLWLILIFKREGDGVRIIGIDPGTAICGYGIIDVQGSKLTPVAYGATYDPEGADGCTAFRNLI